ncbi:MAG: aldo/keto reductase, partial [Leptospiraceae bacterium]|nr:aldo/keto reductase [Leptospiraceae bacterium]
KENEEITSPEETLHVLQDLKKQGKVRFFGLSNETPWGVMEFLKISETKSLPRMISIQNPYNLLNRSFEIGLAEISHRENVGLLAYSPLAFGALSGKYRNGQKPENSRLTLWTRFQRYKNERAIRATDLYCELAEKAGLLPSQMALAFVNSRSFLCSNIIGATTMEQLKENIDSIQISLNKDVLEEIDKIHLEIPNPAP